MRSRAEEQVRGAYRLRMMRLGRRGLSPRPVRWLDPRGVERSYIAYLRNYVKKLVQFSRPLLLQEIQNILEMREDSVTRNDASWRSRVKSLLATLTIEGSRQAEELDPEIYGRRINTYNKVQRNRVVKSVVGVDIFAEEPWLRDEMIAWTSENVRLIKSIPEKMFTDVEKVVIEGVEKGRGLRSLQKDITDRFNVTDRKAKLIARDQVGKLNSDLTKRRQEDLGVKKYLWRNSQDERVRGNPSGLYPNSEYDHWSREGKEYSWDDPPPDGHPGQAIQCRCVAEPVLSHLLDD